MLKVNNGKIYAIPQLIFLCQQLPLPRGIGHSRPNTCNRACGKYVLSGKVFFLITQHKHLLILHKHNSDPVNIHICVFIVFSSIFGNICFASYCWYKQKFYCLYGNLYYKIFSTFKHGVSNILSSLFQQTKQSKEWLLFRSKEMSLKWSELSWATNFQTMLREAVHFLWGFQGEKSWGIQNVEAEFEGGSVLTTSFLSQNDSLLLIFSKEVYDKFWLKTVLLRLKTKSIDLFLGGQVLGRWRLTLWAQRERRFFLLNHFSSIVRVSSKFLYLG